MNFRDIVTAAINGEKARYAAYLEKEAPFRHRYPRLWDTASAMTSQDQGLKEQAGRSQLFTLYVPSPFEFAPAVKIVAQNGASLSISPERNPQVAENLVRITTETADGKRDDREVVNGDAPGAENQVIHTLLKWSAINCPVDHREELANMVERVQDYVERCEATRNGQVQENNVVALGVLSRG